MKTKKLLISIATLGIMLVGVANAAVQQEQCERSDKTVWVKNVQNDDGTRGACVVKDACHNDAFKEFYCSQRFKDIQVRSADKALEIINVFIKEHGGTMCHVEWSDIDNKFGQDFIGCSFDGNYMVFEFDDTNDTTSHDDYAKGLCLAMDGLPVDEDMLISCSSVTKEACRAVIGDYIEYSNTCKIYKR